MTTSADTNYQSMVDLFETDKLGFLKKIKEDLDLLWLRSQNDGTTILELISSSNGIKVDDLRGVLDYHALQDLAYKDKDKFIDLVENAPFLLTVQAAKDNSTILHLICACDMPVQLEDIYSAVAAQSSVLSYNILDLRDKAGYSPRSIYILNNTNYKLVLERIDDLLAAWVKSKKLATLLCYLNDCPTTQNSLGSSSAKKAGFWRRLVHFVFNRMSIKRAEI